MKLIDKDVLVALIDDLLDDEFQYDSCDEATGFQNALIKIKEFINTIEVKDIDLEKLGEIARHLIAVKKHTEDLRLGHEEWSMIERIGYPERFKAQKEK